MGLVIFNSKKVNNLQDESLFGIALVLISLFFDGFASTSQDKDHQKTKREFAYLTMFYNNLVYFVISAAIYTSSVILSNDTSLQRILADSELLRDTLLLSVCGAMGQIFIFLTVSIFDGYKVSIITTSRKCLSVVISNFLFNHKFTQEQWVGASLVMVSAAAEVYIGKDKGKKDPKKEE
jgi:UDP-galactose transporter B1